MRSTALVAAAVSISLVATGCGQTSQSVRSAGDADPVVIPALPSASPVSGLESGGGGIAGAPYTVPGMPGQLGPGDKGIDTRYSQQVPVGGTRVKLTAMAGSSSYRFVVAQAGEKSDGPVLWDSGDAGSNANCSIPKSAKAPKAPKTLRATPGSPYCIVPAGTLKNGGSYVVTTTTVTNGSSRSERRLFTIADVSTVTGSNAVAIKSREVSSPIATAGISLSFSTADQGVTTQTAATTGFRGGLPAGWSWVGMPNGLSKATLGPADGYEKYTDFLTLETSGSSTVLGCKETSIGKECEPMTGSASGVGFAANIPKGSTNITVTRQNDGANWTFDSLGRLTSFSSPGQADYLISYKGDTNLMSSVKLADLQWNFYYGSDKQCNDSGRAPGFSNVPDNMICVLDQPFDQWVKFDYTQPSGATVPRLSRATGAPKSCEYSLGDCDWKDLQIFDIGWDSHNRPEYIRDQITSQAIMAGSLVAGSDPQTDPTTQRIDYDDLGRIKDQYLAALTSNGARQIQNVTYKEFEQVDSRFAPATHQIVTTATMTDGSTKPQTADQAFDDRLRPLFKEEPDGSMTESVWNPTKNIQYAGISSGNVSTTEYDKAGIAVASYTGPGSAFDLSKCTAKAEVSTLDENPCLPTKLDKVVTSKTSYSDPAMVGNGMIAEWYSNPVFSGNPLSTSVATYDNGFSIDVPQGVDAKKWAVDFSGGLALKRQEYSIKVATPDRDVKGTIWIAGNFCAVIDGQSGSCVYDNSKENKFSSDSPIGFGLDLSRNSDAAYSGGKVQITLTPEDGKREPVTNQHFIQRAYTATKTETSDPLPGGKGANTGSMVYYYSDPLAGTATKVDGQALSGDGGGKWTQQASTTQYEPAPFGGARTASVTSAAGSKYTYDYWGIDETPADSGLTNLNQVPDEVKNVPQRGAVKSITDPSGRVTTTINNEYGDVACTRSSNTSNVNSGDWSCTWRDQMNRTLKAVTAGVDGQPAITTTYTYDLVRTPGDRYLSTTSVTSSPGSTDQTVKQTVNTAQKLMDYQDAIGTQGKFTINALGQFTDEQVTAAAVNGKTAAPITLHTTYDQFGNEKDTSIGDLVYSRSNWESAGGGDGQRLASVEYPAYDMRLDEHYDSSNQLEGQTWTLKGGQKIEDKISTTQGSTLLSTEFAGEKAEYDYAGGTVLKRATVAGTDFTYGYDQDGRRVCSAVGIANPGNSPKSCDQIPGHYEYTYANDRVVSTTDPKASIPANSWDSYGNYKQVGNISLSYDAAQQLSKATTPDGGILQVQRDLMGRVVQQTMNAPAAPTELTNAGWKQLRKQLAKHSKLGDNQLQVANQFIASLPAASNAAAQQEPASAQPSRNAAAEEATPQESVASASASTSSASAPASSEPSTPVTQSAPESESAAAPETASAPAGTSESASPSAPAPVAGQSASTQTIRLGYTSANGSPRVIYTDDGAAIIHTFAGGLQLQGATLTIPSLSGIGSVKINADGTRGDRAPVFNGPYGERIGDTDPSIAGTPGARLSIVGVRTFSRDLGTFTQPDPQVAGGAGQYSYGSGDPVNYSDPTGTSSFKDWIKDTLGIGGGNGMSSMWAALTSIGMGVLTGVASAAAFKGMLKFGFFSKNMLGSTAVAAGIFSVIGFGMSAATEAIVSYGHVNWDSAWTWGFNGICASVSGIAGGLGFKVERIITLGKNSAVVEQAGALLQKATTALQETQAAMTQLKGQLNQEIKQVANQATTALKEEVVPTIKVAASKAGASAGGAIVGMTLGGMVGDAVESFTGLPIKPVLTTAGGAIGSYLGPKVTPLIESLKSKTTAYLRETRIGKALNFWGGSHGLPPEGVLSMPVVPREVVHSFGFAEQIDQIQFDFKF